MAIGYKDTYNAIEIINDPTNGLVKLSLSERFESDRKTKISNNFISQLQALDPTVLKDVIKRLNAKLPSPVKDEKILGLVSSGVPLSTALALERGSRFNFSTSGKFSGYEKVFSFSEGHRDDKKHYFYGVEATDSVIIIEDEVTSGNGLISLIKALQKYGVTIIAVCTVIETLTFGAREKIKEETGVDIVSLITVKVS
jgi:adenine phosphoribosyltransferase